MLLTSLTHDNLHGSDNVNILPSPFSISVNTQGKKVCR